MEENNIFGRNDLFAINELVCQVVAYRSKVRLVVDDEEQCVLLFPDTPTKHFDLCRLDAKFFTFRLAGVPDHMILHLNHTCYYPGLHKLWHVLIS